MPPRFCCSVPRGGVDIAAFGAGGCSALSPAIAYACDDMLEGFGSGSSPGRRTRSSNDRPSLRVMMISITRKPSESIEKSYVVRVDSGNLCPATTPRLTRRLCLKRIGPATIVDCCCCCGASFSVLLLTSSAMRKSSKLTESSNISSLRSSVLMTTSESIEGEVMSCNGVSGRAVGISTRATGSEALPGDRASSETSLAPCLRSDHDSRVARPSSIRFFTDSTTPVLSAALLLLPPSQCSASLLVATAVATTVASGAASLAAPSGARRELFKPFNALPSERRESRKLPPSRDVRSRILRSGLVPASLVSTRASRAKRLLLLLPSSPSAPPFRPFRAERVKRRNILAACRVDQLLSELPPPPPSSKDEAPRVGGTTSIGIASAM